jgi:hypothetical protein
MNDLGPEARSMLEAARSAGAPTRADRERIKHAVLLRVATLGAMSTVSTAAGGAVAITLATKVTVAALTVAVLGGGSVSLWAWKAHTAPPAASFRAAQPHAARRTPPAPAARPVVVPEAPAAVEEPGPGPLAPEAPAAGEEPRPKPLPLEVRRREVVRNEARPTETASAPVVESVPAPSPALDSLDPELTVLRQAQEDLRAGLPAQALRRLAEYDRRFGKGTLNEERRAIGAIALCQAHPGPAAQAQAERFLRAAPQSPLVGRVRSACQKSEENAKQFNGIEPDREP